MLTSSIAAQMAGVPNHALYAGSKAAVEGFARSFAVDGGARRITCNAVAPGGVQTDMFDANSWHYVPGGKAGMPLETIKAGLRRMCPLDRVGVPADIGRVVCLLVSDEGEWINGSSFSKSPPPPFSKFISHMVSRALGANVVSFFSLLGQVIRASGGGV